MAVLTTYVSILMNGVEEEKEPAEEDTALQLAYHTLYLFQVLLMDREQRPAYWFMTKMIWVFWVHCLRG